jgi:signal transduction histidine kinase
VHENWISDRLTSNSINWPPLREALTEIKIYCEPAGKDLARILVEDNGIGLDENYLNRIFLPFERLHSPGSYAGTRIGLATCPIVVERHGGTIRAKSLPGKGSTFIIDLPVRQQDQMIFKAVGSPAAFGSAPSPTSCSSLYARA